MITQMARNAASRSAERAARASAATAAVASSSHNRYFNSTSDDDNVHGHSAPHGHSTAAQPGQNHPNRRCLFASYCLNSAEGGRPGNNAAQEAASGENLGTFLFFPLQKNCEECNLTDIS